MKIRILETKIMSWLEVEKKIRKKWNDWSLMYIIIMIVNWIDELFNSLKSTRVSSIYQIYIVKFTFSIFKILFYSYMYHSQHNKNSWMLPRLQEYIWKMWRYVYICKFSPIYSFVCFVCLENINFVFC